jgi:hypothetical protein
VETSASSPLQVESSAPSPLRLSGERLQATAARAMIAPMASRPLAVIIETGTTKVFASALDWPGWCRSARTDEGALEALATYAPRFAPVARRAGLAFPATVADTLDVVERLTGDATTDFGAPSIAAKAEGVRLTAAPARRLSTVVSAAWAEFDEIAAKAPAQLRKGPRGGGRDRDKMIDHVLGAESGYARKLGIRLKAPQVGDDAAIDELREAILSVIGSPTEAAQVVPKGWTTAYAARRIAWHALDHAWEMQDRTER